MAASIQRINTYNTYTLCHHYGHHHRALHQLPRAALALTDRAELEAALAPLGRALLEAAGAHYAARAAAVRRRAADAAAALGGCPPELAVATSFKVCARVCGGMGGGNGERAGPLQQHPLSPQTKQQPPHTITCTQLGVLAEFRQDWPGAVSHYQAAYAALATVPLGRPQPSVQRHFEAARVAGALNAKALTLLLHQQRGADALAQWRAHAAAWAAPPAGCAPAVAAAHYGWLARQHRAAAEMIGAPRRVDAALLAANPDCAPRALLAAAARLALARRAAAEEAARARAEGRAPGVDIDVAAVTRGAYVGQAVLRDPSAAGGQRDLTDAEFAAWLEAEECAADHDAAASELLQSALAAAGAAGAARGRASLAALAGSQHLAGGRAAAARRALLEAAHVYRRDGWAPLLAGVLPQLRDCCARLKLQREAHLHALELASLPLVRGGGASSSSGGGGGGGGSAAADAKAAAAAALAGMLAGAADAPASILKAVAAAAAAPAGSDDGSASPPAAAAAAAAGRGGGGGGATLRYTVQHLDAAQFAAAAAAAAAATPAGDGQRQDGDGAAGPRPQLADLLQQ